MCSRILLHQLFPCFCKLIHFVMSMFLLITRILETSQRPLHLTAQPWNSSRTSLMLTATWHIACRFLHTHTFWKYLRVHEEIIIFALWRIRSSFSNYFCSCHSSRLCVTGQIMMSGWRSLWALWLTSWIRTACLQCTHTTACCIHSPTASARRLLNAMETFAWTRYTQWSKQVNFYSFFGGEGRWLVMAVAGCRDKGKVRDGRETGYI